MYICKKCYGKDHMPIFDKTDYNEKETETVTTHIVF